MNDADFEAIVRYRRGVDPRSVVSGMVADGFDAAAAEAAVIRVQRRLTAEDRKRGVFNLSIGALLFFLGTGLTVWSRMFWGDSFVLAYGAIIGGLGWALLGLSQISSAGRDSELARRSVLGE